MPPRATKRIKKSASRPSTSRPSTPASSPPSSSAPSQSAPPPPSIPPPLPKFVNASAQDNFHNFFSKKKIITGRKVVFSDFGEHLIEHLFDKFKLIEFLSMDLPSYPKLMQVFFANLFIENPTLFSRVCGIDIKMTFTEFANFLGMPLTGLKISPYSLRSFEKYPDGHSLESIDECLHDAPIEDMYNEDIHLYTLLAQIIAKIIFLNLVPKTGEFDHARGCVPILAYCIMKGIPVNIPILILD